MIVGLAENLAFSSVAFCVLQRRPLRGDHAVLAEVALFLGIFYAEFLQKNVFRVAMMDALQATVLQCITMFTLLILWRLSPFHPLAKFPGPWLNKITSLRLAYIVSTGKRHLTIEEYHRRYGTIVRTGPNTLSINSASAVNAIYANSNCFNKSEAYRLGKVQGDGLFFLTDRERHNERRNIWAKAFTPSAIEGYWPYITKRAKQLAAHIEEHSHISPHIDLTDVFQRWTYDIMGEIVFGGSNGLELLRDGDSKKFVQCGHFATRIFEILGTTPWLFDILWYIPVTKDIHALAQLASEFMTHRRNDRGGTSQDLCSHLLSEHENATHALTKKELDIDSTFAIQAGSDTTATVLTISFAYILSTPGVLEKLRKELQDVFPDPSNTFDHRKLLVLPYLNAVVNESLRLGTPFPGLPRAVPKEGAILAGKFIPGGTVVGVPAYSQEVSEENFYPDPLAFRPERWLPQGLGKGSKCYHPALMCFSYGPFSCLGRPIATQEIRVAISHLFMNFDFQFCDGFEPEKFFSGITNVRTTFFDRHIDVKVEKRKT